MPSFGGGNRKGECFVHLVSTTLKKCKQVNTEVCVQIIFAFKEMFPRLEKLSVGVYYFSATVFNAAAITHVKGSGYVGQLL